MTNNTALLGTARNQAREVRALYEILEQRFNGSTWTDQELMIGFSNDVGQVGRLLLARNGTWPIDGDVQRDLSHKLAESLWWAFVLADRVGIDLDQAFATTMASIRAGLETSIAQTSP